MIANHSDAPWTMERCEGYLINGVIHVPNVYDEYAADAKLIIAAPDLLAACISILERLDLEAREIGESTPFIGNALRPVLRGVIGKAILVVEDD